MARRPSDMMASMLDQCPRGWSTENLFVHHLFLSRLPQYLRAQLRTRDTADLRALAGTADELYDLHLPTTVGQVIACLISSQDEPVLAAVSGGPAVSTLAARSLAASSPAASGPAASIPAASGPAASTLAARSSAAREDLDGFLRSSTSQRGKSSWHQVTDTVGDIGNMR
jgi:hypothetical protein